MKYKLTTQEKLKDLRIENGLSLEQLANATGISKSALASYESDSEREIGSYNLSTLAKFYGVSSDYLLGLAETRQASSLSTDSLRISDDAIKVLQSGAYNPLLLSEILTNENFLKLMIDAEIYVDGSVSDQYNFYNKLYKATRAALIKKTHPADYDLHMEKLKKISINEDSFFERTISEDVMQIFREIRAVHLMDFESRTDTAIIDKIISTAEEIAGTEASPMQKFKMIFQKLLGTKNTELPVDADKQIEVILNSELLKPAKTQKKKHR